MVTRGRAASGVIVRGILPDEEPKVAAIGDKIIIQEQEQPGNSTFLSLPGGRGTEGEEPLDAAKRELLEETGYASENWTLFSSVQPIGKIDWTIFTYIARDCTKIAKPHLDAGERITNRLISFDEFLLLSDDDRFDADELNTELFRARLDPTKREDLRKKIFG